MLAHTHTHVCESIPETFFPDGDFGLEVASSQPGGICHEEEDFDPHQLKDLFVGV